MSRAERTQWDQRFRDASHSSTQPDPFLLRIEDYKDLLKGRGKALDVACGAGRHAVWLAEHGWEVTACDISLEGLRRGRTLAAERGVAVSFYCCDLESGQLSANQFDLVVCFFFLQRELLSVMKSSLRPNGLIVFKTYTTDQLKFSGGPTHPLHLLEPQELLNAFRDFRILYYEETTKDRGVAGLIAQKQ